MIMTMLAALALSAQAPASPCTFTVGQDATPSAIVGPADVVKTSRVMAQPDAPLRIIRVNFSGAVFGGSGEGLIRFDVLNASDAPIHGGAIGFIWHAGSRSTSGSASFTNSLEPGATMRLDARLADQEDGAKVTSVLMSVRSANFDGCTYEPAQAVARTIYRRQDGFVPRPAAEACAFSVAGSDAPPKLEGEPELLARLRIASQPGSPLRIVGVDVSRLKLNIGETWLQARGSFTIDVQNVSDRVIEEAGVVLLTRAGGPAGGDPVQFGGPLDHGKTRRLKGTTARFADFQPGATAADVQMLAAIDVVLFDYCIYQPARAFVQAAKAPPARSSAPR